jgi:hypothetical protein
VTHEPGRLLGRLPVQGLVAVVAGHPTQRLREEIRVKNSDPHDGSTFNFGSWIQICTSEKLDPDPHLKSKLRRFRYSSGRPINQRLQILMFDEKLDPDPHESEKLDPDQH